MMDFKVIGIGRDYHAQPYLKKLLALLSRRSDRIEYICWQRGARDVRSQEEDSVASKVMLTTGRVGSRASLFYYYVRWFFILLRMFFKNRRSKSIFFVSRIDAALPAALINVFTRGRVRYIYLDRDSSALTYGNNFIKLGLSYLEKLVSKRALAHFVPGHSRTINLGSYMDKVFVVENTPTTHFLHSSNKLANKWRDLLDNNKRVVYVNGWLADGRGVSFIIKALDLIDFSKVQLVVAGHYVDDSDGAKLAQDSRVMYVGSLPADEAFAITTLSDIVLAFYNPSIEINRRAEPNKWFDCYFAKTPFLTNFGLATATKFVNTGFADRIEYGDSESLAEYLNSLVDKTNRKFSDIPKIECWDVKFEKALNNILGGYHGS